MEQEELGDEATLVENAGTLKEHLCEVATHGRLHKSVNKRGQGLRWVSSPRYFSQESEETFSSVRETPAISMEVIREPTYTLVTLACAFSTAKPHNISS